MACRDGGFQGRQLCGRGRQWLPLLTGEVVPQVERLLDAPPAWRCLAGYSLAGLFAVWTAFQTDLFTRILSASGSMWYPGWLEYARQHETAVPLQGVYLSVGDKESTSRNAVLQTVGERTQALADLLASRGVNVKFELNPGNHFKNPPLRVVKGIKWLLQQATTHNRRGYNKRSSEGNEYNSNLATLFDDDNWFTT